MRVPFVYRKIAELFDGEELSAVQFQKALLSFRISKKDWFALAKDLNGFGVVDIDGKYQNIKVRPSR